MRRSTVVLALLASACRSPAAPPPKVSASVAVESIPRCVEDADVRAATMPFGTAHPGLAYRASRKAGWAVVCEARQDTTGDGKIRVLSGHHGELLGDDVVAYLSIGGGAGINIDDFVARDPSGRFVVVIQFKKLLLFDVATGARTPLDGDVVDVDPVSGPHRAAAFSPDGRLMLYHRRGLVVVRELLTCLERSLDLGPGLVGRAGFDVDSNAVIVEHIERDTNGDGYLSAKVSDTTLSARFCRGAAASASFFGASGDQPSFKRVPLAGGVTTIVPSGSYWVAKDDAREVVPVSGAKPKFGEAPIGPFVFTE